MTAPMELPDELIRLIPTHKKPGAAGAAPARHRRDQLPCAADLMQHLRLVEAGSLMRLLEQQLEQAMKDKSYQQTPIGDQARQFLDDLRWGGSPINTLNTYELVLARLSIEFGELAGIHEFCTQDGHQQLKSFYECRWGNAAPGTKGTYVAAGRSFGNWAEEHGLCPYNPFRRVKMPRRTDTLRVAHPPGEMQQLLSGQASLRNECGLGIFVAHAARKNDVRMMQIRDIDLARGYIYYRHRKGGQVIALPIEYPWLKDNLYLHIQGEQRNPLEYLIYPKNDRSRPMDHSSFHRWFKKCLEQAGLPDFPLHELRHTAADEIFRRTGNLVAAQKLLGHKHIETTRNYVHPSDDDLRAWMQTPEKV